jgi:hypothetical protein
VEATQTDVPTFEEALQTADERVAQFYGGTDEEDAADAILRIVHG